MGRHSAGSHDDETDIIAQVVDVVEEINQIPLIGGGTVPISTAKKWVAEDDAAKAEIHRHFTPMFKGLHDTDEHVDMDKLREDMATTAATEVPPKGANPSALWTVSVIAVIMTIASLALAAYLEFRPTPKAPCPIRLVPSQIITPAPVTVTVSP